MILTLVRPISSRTYFSASHSIAKQSAKSAREVPRGAAVADHRVLLVRLVQLGPPTQVGVLVGLEVATSARSPAWGANAAAIVDDALGDALHEELPRAGVRRDRPRRSAACSGVASRVRSRSSSALGWMPICRLMMNSSRASPTPSLRQPGERERLVRRADVHHDLDRRCPASRRARSPRRRSRAAPS